VAAHNEEAVIGNIVRNLSTINYPRDMYDIFVIADNCTDKTAQVARENGAIVYERYNNVQRGKGFALEWMFEKVFVMEKKYDAVCIFDADNLVSSNFLMEMNKHLCMGHKVIQGYLDSKNPNDTWISGNNSITFWISNRMYQLPRYYLGLSCVLGGTGLVISTDVLKEIGWGATCLTEDLEFTLKLVLKGMKVYWAHDAVIYDEKPLTMAASWRQRTRWMQGQCDCIRRFFKDLLVKAVKDKDVVALDIALYLIQPMIVVINAIAMVFGVLVMINNLYTGETKGFTVAMLVVMIALFYMHIFFVIIEGKLNNKTFAHYITFPFYNFTWVPIIIQGFMNRNRNEWVHTLHTRVLDIKDI